MSGFEAERICGQLSARIEKLYEVFPSEAPAVIEGCPCCIDTRGTDILLTSPRRSLSGDQLWRYITGAYLTVGSDLDFRYLLPRIFELAATEPYEVPDAQIILGKLGRADWATWPSVEREALAQFFPAWFQYAMERELAGDPDDICASLPEGVLCGIALANLPLADFLVVMTDDRYAPILRKLREWSGRECAGFWEDAPEALAEYQRALRQGADKHCPASEAEA